MSTAIGDQAAINFAAAFYQALAYGRNVKTAFGLGCNQIDCQGLKSRIRLSCLPPVAIRLR